MLPPHLELASRLNSPTTRDACLAQLATRMKDDTAKPVADLLRPVLPYLTLDTLLALRLRGRSGQGGEGVGDSDLAPLADEVDQKLYDLMDYQRDWVTSSECPAELRDGYLVRVCGGKEAWGGVQNGMDEVAQKMGDEVKKGIVLESKKEKVEKGKVCGSLDDFKEGLKKLTGGLLEKLDWSNVVLGGGSVLSILTGKQNDKSYADSDLDLFLYGLKPEELIPKVSAIIDQIKAALPPLPKKTKTKYDLETGKYTEVEVADDDEDYMMDRYFEWDSHHQGELMILKGFNAISLIPPRNIPNRRVIQIVLVSNETIFDALAPFDLDACCVGWTGKEVIALPRAARALSLGGWTGGVNLLDIKLARKLDPTSATVSSRALKYLARGFSLALPQAALKILATEGVSLADALKHGTAKAGSEGERKKAKVEELAGLEGLMRRKWNKENGMGKREAMGADYGPASLGYMKPIVSGDLRYENGEIEHETWEFQIKLASSVHDLVAQDDADMPKGKGAVARNIATYVVPYVPGFDKDLLLGLKPADEAREEYAWSKIVNLQYAVKIPRNLLPLAEKADAKMKEIIAASSAAEGSASPLKKAKGAQEATLSPALSSEEVEGIKQALEIVNAVAPATKSESVKRNEDIYPSTSSAGALKPLIPDSFASPFKGERHLLYGYGMFGSSSKAKKDAEEKKKKQAEKEKGKKGAESFLSPLVGYDGSEVAVTKKTAKATWKVATLSGMWAFKGLDEEIDRVRDAVWQAHVLTARTAVALPAGIPLWLLATPTNRWPGPDDDIDIVGILSTAKGPKKDALERYLAQPSVADVLAKMKVEMGKLEKLVKASTASGGGMEKVGEWDEERERFLVQWIKGEEMI
ncbi:hypothetical protein JCM6882_002757 [Rhodosporidiobolus microsporus]